MINYKYKFNKILILILLFSFQFEPNLKSQNDLRKDTTFFYSKKKEISYWLKKTGIDQVFYLDEINVKRNKLTLSFASKYNAIDSLSVVWQKLRHSFNPKDYDAISRKIFNSMAFEMELGKDSLFIVLASNIKNYKVKINFDNKKGIVVKEHNKNELTRGFNVVSLDLNAIDLPNRAVSESIDNMSMRAIRANISKFLKKFYKEKGTFWYDAKFEIMQENYNELTFEVTRLSKEILNDRNYFEYIRINIKIIKKEDKIDMKYEIMGKYSGGFGFEPRRSEYRNMDPDFSDYLRRYQLKLAREIKESFDNR